LLFISVISEILSLKIRLDSLLDGGCRMKRNSFYWKLFTSFLLIIVFYTLVATSVFYYKNSQIAESERRTNHQALLKQMKDNIDSKLRFAFQAILQLESNEVFKQFSANPDPAPDYYQMSLVKDLLQNDISFKSQFDYDFGILRVENNTVITPYQTVPKDYYFKQLGLSSIDIKSINEFSIDQKGILENYKMLVVSNEQSDKNSKITIVKKESIDRNQNILFFVTLPTSSLYPENIVSTEIFGIINDSEIVNVRTALEKEDVDIIFTPNFIQTLEEGIESRDIYTIEKAGYNIYSINSDTLKNFSYLYVAPQSVVSVGMPNLWLSSFVVFIGLLLIGVVFTRLFLMRTYSPIRHLVGLLKGDHKGEQNEFVMIEDAINQLKTTNDSLRITIQNNQLSLKDKYLRELLLGIVDKEQAMEQIQKLQLEVLCHPFHMVIFEFQYEKRLQDSLSSEGSLALKLQTLSFLKNQVESEGMGDLVEYDAEKVVIFTKKKEIDDVKKWVQSFVYDLDEDIHISLTAAISEIVTSVHQIDTVFKNTLNLFEYRFAMEKTPILTVSDVQPLVQTNYYYPLDVERELIDASTRGEEQAAWLILDRILEENLTVRNLNHNALSQFVMAVFVTISRILQATNKSNDQLIAEEQTSYFDIKKSDDKSTLEAKIRRTFRFILMEIQSANEQEKLSMSDQLASFIYEHYDQDISLTDLAEHFNLTSSYISTIFKTNLGENFKDFLNQHRIQKAKGILETEDVKIHQVAERVGYNNVNTFIRIFKKYVGLSPGQFQAMRMSVNHNKSLIEK
jgi:two-component system, response regulator YesN